jgi:hypothetical protein
MHVFMLEIVCICWVLWTNVMLKLKCMCSCSKLCCMQRTSVWCQNCVICSKLVFATEIVLFVGNQHSLLKLCCVQRTSVCCCLQWTSVHCWNCVVCSKLMFVESVLSAANQHSLPKFCCLHRTSATVESKVVNSILTGVSFFQLEWNVSVSKFFSVPFRGCTVHIYIYIYIFNKHN